WPGAAGVARALCFWAARPDQWAAGRTREALDSQAALQVAGIQKPERREMSTPEAQTAGLSAHRDWREPREEPWEKHPLGSPSGRVGEAGTRRQAAPWKAYAYCWLASRLAEVRPSWWPA